jgi:hypothetical protein
MNVGLLRSKFEYTTQYGHQQTPTNTGVNYPYASQTQKEGFEVSLQTDRMHVSAKLGVQIQVVVL